MNEIIELLKNRDMDRIRELALQKKSILTKLLARTFDPDKAIRWQAIEGLAISASIWVEKDLPFVQNFCRRLIWMLNDESGNMGWFAPQALGAILAENHRHLADFLPLLLSHMDEKNEDAITCGLLWALGRIGPINPQFAETAQRKIRPYLNFTVLEIREQAQKSYQIMASDANE